MHVKEFVCSVAGSSFPTERRQGHSYLLSPWDLHRLGGGSFTSPESVVVLMFVVICIGIAQDMHRLGGASFTSPESPQVCSYSFDICGDHI